MGKQTSRFSGLFLALAFATAAGSAVAGTAQDVEPTWSRPIPPPSQPVDWTPAPGPWVDLEGVEIADRSDRHWKLDVASRQIGFLRGEHSEFTVSLPRIRIARIDDAGEHDAALLLPVDNRSVSIFPPGSPEESSIPQRRTEDGLALWPNLCTLSLLDTSGRLDLDDDGFDEITIRRFCSCGETGCSGILVLELEPGNLNLIDPARLVDSIRLGRITLERVLGDGAAARPLLEILPDYLEECRFIAAIGVRGSTDCSDCCRFTVLLSPIDGGRYEPTFDRQTHNRLLKRMKDDLGYVAAGDVEEPMRSFEEAQIAHVASFFYLTGIGRETRETVLGGLGPRGRTFQAQDLMQRLDRYFLAPGDD